MAPNGQAFSLVFSRALGKVIVHIHGPLDLDSAPEVAARLTDVIEGQGNRDLVADLRGTTQIDAVGLSVLVAALKSMRARGGALVLSGMTGRVAGSIEAAGLDKVFDFTPEWTHPARGDRHTWGGVAGPRAV